MVRPLCAHRIYEQSHRWSPLLQMSPHSSRKNRMNKWWGEATRKPRSWQTVYLTICLYSDWNPTEIRFREGSCFRILFRIICWLWAVCNSFNFERSQDKHSGPTVMLISKVRSIHGRANSAFHYSEWQVPCLDYWSVMWTIPRGRKRSSGCIFSL